jgi:hypothetical protein
MSKFVLMSAARFEAEPTIKLFDHHGVDYDYHEVGIGSIKSAQASQRLNLSGKHVIFIGSCGVFNEDLDVKLITSKKCFWSPPSTRSGQSHLIDGIEDSIEFYNPHKLSSELDHYTVAASPSITVDENLVPSQKKCVENLELYSLASKLCEAASTLLVLGVTNKVHISGREEWAKNFKTISYMTADFFAKHIKAL